MIRTSVQDGVGGKYPCFPFSSVFRAFFRCQTFSSPAIQATQGEYTLLRTCTNLKRAAAMAFQDRPRHSEACPALQGTQQPPRACTPMPSSPFANECQ